MFTIFIYLQLKYLELSNTTDYTWLYIFNVGKPLLYNHLCNLCDIVTVSIKTKPQERERKTSYNTWHGALGLATLHPLATLVPPVVLVGEHHVHIDVVVRRGVQQTYVKAEERKHPPGKKKTKQNKGGSITRLANGPLGPTDSFHLFI